jgi:uracil-DNA glycosylase
MASCSPNILKELKLTKPQLVILLGKQVIEFFETMSNMRSPGFDDSFTYDALTIDIVPAQMLCVHHPSFINVYRRKRMSEYRNGIARAISDACKVAPAPVP